MRGAPPPGCRATALGFLARRDHTRVELARKLSKKGFDREEVDAVLDGLAARGLLDDRRTASLLVRSRTGRGRARLAAELAAKGVSREDAALALAELDPEDEKASLRQALERKARTLSPGLTPGDRSKKLFAHLVRRGFSSGAVLEELRSGRVGSFQKETDVDDESS